MKININENTQHLIRNILYIDTDTFSKHLQVILVKLVEIRDTVIKDY